MQPTIFVSIASYRDSDCKHTISDLFKQAQNPDRIFIGVCHQYDLSVDEGSDSLREIRSNQIKILSVEASQSKGACWARSLTQSLYSNEDYYLQIDSHMRFEKDWDATLISMLAKCSTEKAILTTYPPGFIPPRQLGERALTSVRAKSFNVSGILLQESYSIAKTEIPLRSYFIAAGFLFTTSNFINEIKYDPYLYFEGEEITLAVRSWTHGWDIFAPNEVVIYHHYRISQQSDRRVHWEDKNDWYLLDTISKKRILHLLDVKKAEDSALIDLDKYSLGSVRSLQDYEEKSHVNFKNKTFS